MQADVSIEGRTPRFWGLVQAELMKLYKQPLIWVAALVVLAAIAGMNFLALMNYSSSPDLAENPAHQAVLFWKFQMSFLIGLRMFGGAFLMFATAYLIGMEYQHGTMRVLIGRGVNKLALLYAKGIALLLVALVVLVGGLLAHALGSLLVALLVTGNLNVLKAVDSGLLSDVGLYALTLVISEVVTVIMAMGVTVLGRSLAFGMTAAFSWFAVDNMLPSFLSLATRFTHNAFFVDVQQYLLGPAINILPKKLIGDKIRVAFGPQEANLPFAGFLGVIAVYTVVFLVVATVLMARRDVHE